MKSRDYAAICGLAAYIDRQLAGGFSKGARVYAVGIIAVIYNIAAICGGVLFGSLSERFGRRRCIVTAALLSLPPLPSDLGLSSSTVLHAVGASLMQFTVRGAWGIVPVHLNELSPDGSRGTFPGFVYQLGNLLASVNATLQAGLAAHFGGNYGIALVIVAGTVAVLIAILTALGREARGVSFAKDPPSPGAA